MNLYLCDNGNISIGCSSTIQCYHCTDRDYYSLGYKTSISHVNRSSTIIEIDSVQTEYKNRALQFVECERHKDIVTRCGARSVIRNMMTQTDEKFYLKWKNVTLAERAYNLLIDSSSALVLMETFYVYFFFSLFQS